MYYDGLSRLISESLQFIFGACGNSFSDFEGMLCAIDGFLFNPVEDVDSLQLYSTLCVDLEESSSRL